MRKIIGPMPFRMFMFAGALLLVFLITAGCSSGEKEDFRVGIMLQLTADDGNRAEALQAAVTKVVEGVNSSGGIRGRLVKIIIVNGLEEESETLLVAKKLMEMDYTHAVICYSGRGLTPAIPRAFVKGRTPLLLYGPEPVEERYLNDWVYALPAAGKEVFDEGQEMSKALDIVFDSIRESGRDKARIRKSIEKRVSATE